MYLTESHKIYKMNDLLNEMQYENFLISAKSWLEKGAELDKGGADPPLVPPLIPP